MAWPKSERNNVAPTINHRLSDLRGFCKYLYKKNAISLDAYEAIREISDVDDEGFSILHGFQLMMCTWFLKVQIATVKL